MAEKPDPSVTSRFRVRIPTCVNHRWVVRVRTPKALPRRLLGLARVARCFHTHASCLIRPLAMCYPNFGREYVRQIVFCATEKSVDEQTLPETLQGKPSAPSAGNPLRHRRKEWGTLAYSRLSNLLADFLKSASSNNLDRRVAFESYTRRAHNPVCTRIWLFTRWSSICEHWTQNRPDRLVANKDENW